MSNETVKPEVLVTKPTTFHCMHCGKMSDVILTATVTEEQDTDWRDGYDAGECCGQQEASESKGE